STVYSYLPTDERSGLRFFVQGHFDVPVDRERVSPESTWNQRIVSVTPDVLAHAVRAAIDAEPTPETARGVLTVLPRAHELGSPLFTPIPDRLRDVFAMVPVLPCIDGELHVAQDVVQMNARMAALFDGASVDLTGVAPAPEKLVDAPDPPLPRRSLHILEATLPQRSHLVASDLGARPFSFADLVALLEHPRRIPALAHDDPEALLEGAATLYDVLLDGLDHAEREGPSLKAMGLRQHIRKRAIVVDAFGRLGPATSITRGSPQLRELYAERRRFVHPSFDPEHADDKAPAPPASRARVFLDRLGLATLSALDLVTDLEAHLGAKTHVTDFLEGSFPRDARGFSIVHAQMIDAPWTMHRRIAMLPVFPASDGAWRPISGPNCARVIGPDTPDALAKAWSSKLPVVRPEPDTPLADLLRAMNHPALSTADLVDALEDHPDLLDDDNSLGTLNLLSALDGDLTAGERQRLATLPLWPTTAGSRRALAGEGAAMIPERDELSTLFPDVAFVHPAARELAITRSANPARIGSCALLEAMSPGARAPLAITPTPEVARAVRAFLASADDPLGRREIALVETLPLFPSSSGEVRRLVTLHDAPKQLRDVYAAAREVRPLIDLDDTTRALLERLRLSARLKTLEVRDLIADIKAHPDAFAGCEPRIRTVLNAHAPSMARDTAQAACALPLFP
ncbi:MAG: hypothetical protein AAGI01_16300, partial [Myxococcota bacterium]